jgi:hypothetical protein
VLLFCSPLNDSILESVEDVFFVGEVIENDIVESTMRVRWYKPTIISKTKFKKDWHKMNFKVELTPVRCAGQRQNGAVRTRLEQSEQELSYNECCFAFSKLEETGGLHPEVQRQLRSLGLATGTIKRGVANRLRN